MRKLGFLLLIAFTLGTVKEGALAAVKASSKKAPAKVEVVTPKAAHKVITPEAAATGEVVAKKEIKFKDLSPKHPAYPLVMKMIVSYEVLSGYPDKTFKGEKTITRAEFSKVLTNALAYFEKKYEVPLAEEPATSEVSFKDLKATHWAYPFVAKLVTKYKVLSGYPDGTYKPNKTITRYELATVWAKMLKLIYDRYEMELPVVTKEVALEDVKPKHWAMKDIQLLLALKVMSAEEQKVKKKKIYLFGGSKNVNRFEVSVTGAKLMEKLDLALAALPKEKLEALLKKYRPEAAPPAPPSLVEKALEIPRKPTASISGGWGNIYESASGTNNWLGFFGSASYGDVFSIWMLSGNYELTGKYGFNQVVYLVPGGGGRVSGGVNNESRYEIELNTIYPVVEFFGISGKLLLGAKYINLSNPTAPTNFTGFNAGLVTSAKVLDRNLLLRAFYSLPLIRAQLSPSVLGQPAQLFDYEASLDAEFYGYPLLLGFSGEMMTLSGGGIRYYNSLFARYFLF